MKCPKCGSKIPKGTTHQCGIVPRVVIGTMLKRYWNCTNSHYFRRHNYPGTCYPLNDQQCEDCDRFSPRAITGQLLKQYEENLPLDLQKELEDLRAMREASGIKG